MPPEYPPLLQPGFVDVSLDNLEPIFVDCFTDRTTRLDLVKHLRGFVSLLQSLGLTGTTLWLDGSFVTHKPHPGDIDVLLLAPEAVLRALSPSDLDSFRNLVHNKRATKLRHRCDLYFCDPDEADWRSYWRGWFGFDRNEEPKGIARLAI